METQSEVSANSHAPTSVLPSIGNAPSSADALSSTAQGAPSSPVPVKPVAVAGNSQSQLASESAALPVMSSSMMTNADEVQTTKSPVAGVPKNAEINATAVNTITAPMSDSFSAHDKPSSEDDAPAQDKQEAEKDVVIDEKVNNVTLEEKSVNQDPLLYADKLEAKNAFKALLESANVGSEWTWDQAMRVIINDKRYGALKTLGERKQAFNEFLGQKRKQEAEERRVKQKKAREEFKKMLEGSKELTASMRWSKVATLFENDERFKAVERERDRRDLIETYLQELEEKAVFGIVRIYKGNLLAKLISHFQDRLEADERCSRLEKIDRLEIFQDYLHDLVKEEEEQRKIQKEEQRKAERKNRDEFRKLLEEHVASGTLTAKTNWHDYHLKVKDLHAYVAVASNASGSTPKDLFEDVSEELQKQYHEDKTRIKDVVKLKKVPLASNWTLQNMKVAIIEDVNSPPISDVNLKMVFDELLERAREKEEKEAKKRKRLADDFLNLLQSIKDITASSKWESFKEIFKRSQEYSSIGEEAFFREMFEEYISQLKEQEKENERKRKEEKAKKEKEREERDRRKAKHRSEKERGHERDKEHTRKEEADVEISDRTETQVCSDKKRSGSDNSSRKQRKRHQNAVDDLDESEKDRSKSSHRHGSNDHKKSRRHGSTPESDSESRHKRHKRDHRNGSRRAGDNEDLEDGEFGEDRETR
ncbi:hypothetical protein NC651_022415 [Populus alba x Populus x berolinensis]|nr:hypothetical protein NC651_022415 [Populus alba x Populus x berolinensis]